MPMWKCVLLEHLTHWYIVADLINMSPLYLAKGVCQIHGSMQGMGDYWPPFIAASLLTACWHHHVLLPVICRAVHRTVLWVRPYIWQVKTGPPVPTLYRIPRCLELKRDGTGEFTAILQVTGYLLKTKWQVPLDFGPSASCLYVLVPDATSFLPA